jgi:hypothetical protein
MGRRAQCFRDRRAGGQLGSGDGISYNDKDGGQRHKRGGVDNDDKQ